MKENLNHVLTNLGFDEKEARIFLALVELGEATVLQISRASGVNRASIYYILEKMKQRGTVAVLEKSGGEVFTAVDPRLLLAREKQRVKDFERAVPELDSLINKTGHRPHVRFFEGVEAVKALYADSLNAKTEILNYANSRDIREVWPEYDEEYVAQRAQRKIWLRGIAPKDAYGQRVHGQDKTCHREIRLIDPKKLAFNNEINIYDDKIALVSFRDGVFGVMIESKDLAETQRSIFEMAWSFAKSATGSF